MPLPMYQDEIPSQGGLSQVSTVLAIASGKGGVGKSFVTVNLALALKQLGFSVGILDADIYGPSLKRYLPEDRLPGKSGDLLVPALSKGIRMMTMAYFQQDDSAAAVRAPIANRIVTQFTKEVLWGELDFLLIDFPPGTGDIQLTLSQQAGLSAALIVTTPQDMALLDVVKSMDLFDQVQVPILGIVENMSYYLPNDGGEKVFIFGKDGGKVLAQDKGVPLLAQLPLQEKARACSDAGQSIFSKEPQGFMATSLISFAKQVIAQLKVMKEGSVSFQLEWKDCDVVAEYEKQEISLEEQLEGAFYIKKIEQIDAISFEIQWNNGDLMHYFLQDLQSYCPCVICQGHGDVKEPLRAKSMSSVGRYALRIEFTSGCSNGIFTYALLHAMGRVLYEKV